MLSCLNHCPDPSVAREILKQLFKKLNLLVIDFKVIEFNFYWLAAVPVRW